MSGKILLAALFSCAMMLSPHSLAKDRDGNNGPYPKISVLSNHPDTATIRIIGDVMLHTTQITSDWSTFLSGIEEDLRQADVAIANMEFSLGGAPYTGYPAFSAPDAYAEYIAGTGINVLLTANNHILDRGSRGMERTLAIYSKMEESHDLAYTGSGTGVDDFMQRNPLFIRAKGIRIALVNITYGTNAKPSSEYPRPALLEEGRKLIEKARNEGADIVIALPHWGTEYNTRHSQKQEKIAHELAIAGADIIVGAHPHVVQDMGKIRAADSDGIVRDVQVFYSIGNAVSNMSAKNTQAGLMITLQAVRHPDGKVEILAPSWDWIWCTRPGKLCSSYKTIKTNDWTHRRDEWTIPSDYDNMTATIRRLKTETGLE